MNIKKTIGISIVFHLAIFSAALLFSAELFKGSRENADEKVFFVKLAPEENMLENTPLLSNIKLSVQKKGKEVQERKKPPIVTDELIERVKPEVTLKKATERIKAAAAVSDIHTQDTVEASTNKTPVIDEAPEHIDNHQETAHTSLLTSVSKKTGLRNGPARSDLSPSMIDLIGRAIERAKTYPVLARQRGMEGTVYVSFRVTPSGEPDEIEIKKSSGHRILDSATVKVVQKAAPYPLLDNRVEVPVAYRLRK